jgi:hypothetical protein
MERYDCILSVEEPIVLQDGVRILVSGRVGSRAASVVISTSSGELALADFAEQRFDPKVGALTPFCEVVRWKRWIFILGLPEIVIAGPGVLLKCELFRKPTDDSGFYQSDWAEIGGRIFCIYEGGVVAIGSEGAVLWHIQKAWDDTFAGVRDGNLLMVEAKGQRVALDGTTGARMPPPPDSPPSVQSG